MKEAIKVENLSKSYGTHQVLRGISFTVYQGEIFALLGVNGAGKTTTLECLEGIRGYESGTILIEGTRGVQLQSSSLPQNMKAIEALHLFAKWNHTDVSAEYLSRIGVTPFKDKQYKELSTGQKRRLHLALAMLSDPDVIFLDEPTAGLDVEGRAALHDEIRSLKALGKTIIVASHDMAEVEELCDKIAILKDGNIVFYGTVDDLTKNSRGVYQMQIGFIGKPSFPNLDHSILKEENQDYFVFETKNLNDALHEITGLLMAQNILIEDIKVEQASLQHCFLAIAKGEY